MCGDPYSVLLRLTHPSAHTQQWVVNKDTHTHIQKVRQLMLRRSVSSWVFSALLKGLLSRGIDESWLFTPPTDSPGQTWDSNPQPSGYKSDSLTIRPQLSP